MKILRITTNTDENFKLSSDQLRCANSFDFFTTENFEEGIRQFNKLTVEADLYLIDYTLKDRPIFTRVATKNIARKVSNCRILETRVLKNVDNEFQNVLQGEQTINLF